MIAGISDEVDSAAGNRARRQVGIAEHDLDLLDLDAEQLPRPSGAMAV